MALIGQIIQNQSAQRTRQPKVRLLNKDALGDDSGALVQLKTRDDIMVVAQRLKTRPSQITLNYKNNAPPLRRQIQISTTKNQIKDLLKSISFLQKLAHRNYKHPLLFLKKKLNQTHLYFAAYSY